jgi:hypothetical protein
MAQAISRWPVTGETPIRARSVHLGFLMGTVALGQVSLRVLLFLLSVSFHRGSPYSYIVCGMNNRPVGGRSSETQSHTVDINNTLKYSLRIMKTYGGRIAPYILNLSIRWGEAVGKWVATTW